VTSLPSEPATPVPPRTGTGARTRKLNATSYVVLGMLCHGPATSYDLKQRVAYTIGNFWAFAHSQLYDEPARLVADGLVSETVEQGGRRRRTYSITDDGRTALRDWLATPTTEQTEVRDLGLLKLFFASFGEKADLLQLARDRHESHRARANGYVEQHERIVDVADPWQVKTLELGMRYERTVERFWADFIAELETSEDQKSE
jgi:DNA-binding PadR family transcriptional regulator